MTGRLRFELGMRERERSGDLVDGASWEENREF